MPDRSLQLEQNVLLFLWDEVLQNPMPFEQLKILICQNKGSLKIAIASCRMVRRSDNIFSILYLYTRVHSINIYLYILA